MAFNGFSRGNGHPPPMADINTTPLVDVMLVLLVIFLITAPVLHQAVSIDLLTAQKQVDSIDMKAMREELKAVERLRKAADQLARQERDKPRDRGPER